jgi:asparagine synthase (glutamine-hydrolysing)
LSIQDAICALHNTALQRVDRSAAAHNTGVAVPFLDPNVVRYALAIPARWKIRGPQEMEKWPLRQSLSHALPGEVIWRGKSKFWEGSGSGETLSVFAEGVISDEEFAAARDLGIDGQINSKEELLYYRIFKERFGDSIPLSEVGRTKYI